MFINHPHCFVQNTHDLAHLKLNSEWSAQIAGNTVVTNQSSLNNYDRTVPNGVQDPLEDKTCEIK